MMMGRIFLTFTVFLLTGSYAFAEGFYAGADVAVTNIEDSAQGLSFRDRPVGWKLHAGYEFSDYFALEGSYFDSGEAEDTVSDENVKAEFSGYIMSLVLQSAVTTPNLFTKLGYYNGDQEVSAQGGSLKDDVDGFAAGIGFRHEVYERLAIRGELDWFEADLDNFWSAGIGVQYSFGN